MSDEPAEAREIRAGIEIRAEVDDDGGRHLAGMLVPYDTPTTIAGRYVERVAPGCFRKSIAEAARRLPLLFMHRHDEPPIGSAVEWRSRDDGLYGVWRLADTGAADEAFGLVRDGHMTGLSVGFSPITSDWDLKDPPELDTVTRREARLLEASIVTIPAYDTATAAIVRTAEGRERSSTPHLDVWRQWREGL